jgi:threonine synthase
VRIRPLGGRVVTPQSDTRSTDDEQEVAMTAGNGSLAVEQVSTGPQRTTYPLFPVISTGCPVESTAAVQYPLEVGYDVERLDSAFFDQPAEPGLARWQALLPPLAAGVSLGEGGTPLVADDHLARWAGYDGELFVKIEAGNPTGSHKDRLNVCAVSAAVASDAGGILVASSGNHAISAAAYACRAEMPCIALVSESLAGSSAEWLAAYSPAAVRVPQELKWPLLNRLRDATGFQPVSNLTSTHTGHPFGPEGYKTIAYEIRAQLGGAVPGAVFVPTGYGEMLFGLLRGFQELVTARLTSQVPALYACEPAARGPLAKALTTGQPAAHVPANPTIAGGIACRVNSYRGVLAVQESRGGSCLVTDDELNDAAIVLRERGFWNEPSCGAGLAGLRQLSATTQLPGPVICVLPSQGIKTRTNEDETSSLPWAGSWESLLAALRDDYDISLN